MKYIFNKFKFMLGARCIDWNRSFNIYLTPKFTTAQLKEINDASYEKPWKTIISNYHLFKLGQMNGASLDSINHITGTEADSTYEEMHSTPCSAVLFSDQCPADCFIKRDYEWESVADTPENVEKAVFNGTTTNYFNGDYWDLNYGFNNSYVKEEYDYYNVKTNPLTEDIIVVNAGANSVSAAADVNTTNTDGHLAGFGILVETLHKDSPIDKENNTTNHIPVSYVEFDRFHDAKNGTMNIVWNANGFMRLE